MQSLQAVSTGKGPATTRLTVRPTHGLRHMVKNGLVGSLVGHLDTKNANQRASLRPNHRCKKSSKSSLKRTPSFTVLDPTSGIPSEDATLRLRASLTSRSFNRSNSHHLNAMASYISQQAQINQSQSQLMYNNQQQNQKTLLNRRYSQPNLVSLIHCNCYGLPMICDRCTGPTKRSLKAARAGTPGFRPG